MTRADLPAGPAGIPASMERPTRYTVAVAYRPFAYAIAGVAASVRAGPTLACLGVAAAWVYLLPPLLARLVFLGFGRPEGRALRQGDRAYKVWWLVLHLQALHNRLPWLEELLRLVPGLYAAWLNAWGARVSPLVYWAPGSRVVDRSLVEVGPYAVIGIEAGMTGHLAGLAPDGSYRVDVAPSRIGAGAVLGGRSGLGPGCVLHPGEMLPVGRLLAPFTHWRDGRRWAEAAA